MAAPRQQAKAQISLLFFATPIEVDSAEAAPMSLMVDLLPSVPQCQRQGLEAPFTDNKKRRC
jgi:hypothetical protein